MILTDSRGRATLGAANQAYAVTELPEGSLLLEPAQFMTRADIALLSNPTLKDQVVESMTNPDQAVPYRRRTQRKNNA
jgi:hypothetical protein